MHEELKTLMRACVSYHPDNTDANNMVMDMLNEDDFSEEDDEGPSIFANPPTNRSGHRRRILSEVGEGSGSSRPILNFTQ